MSFECLDSGDYAIGPSAVIDGQDARTFLCRFKIDTLAKAALIGLDRATGFGRYDGLLIRNERYVTGITRSGSTATATTLVAHGYSNSDSITMSGADQSEYNGAFTISNVTSTTFDFTVTGTPATPATTSDTFQALKSGDWHLAYEVDNGSSTFVDHSTTLSTDTWYFAAGRCPVGSGFLTRQLDLDGVEVTGSINTTISADVMVLGIKRHQGAVDYTHSSTLTIDYAAFYNTELSDTDIGNVQTDTNKPDEVGGANLQFYSGNVTSLPGGVIDDQTANNNDLTVTGASATSEDPLSSGTNIILFDHAAGF